MSSFVKIALPPVSQEFIKALKAAFRPYEVKPGFDRDELMQSTGEQKVIEWIMHHAYSERTATGEATAVRSNMPTGAIVKIGE